MARPLLAEARPELTNELRALLREANEVDLVSQVDSLEIFDRCRCGDSFCATFYTAGKPIGAWGVGHETISLDPEKGMLNLDILNGKIVCIEALYRDEIRDRLLDIFK